MTEQVHADSIEFGLDTFGDVTQAPDGGPVSQAQVIRNVVEEGVLADQVGLSFFGVGEHHREDFAVSAPDVVLAAIAARTTNIHVGSAVTVLSSDDPVRVFQRFSTLDAISDGRAEVILGRGSFTESFPLFGYELSDYEVLFEEKLDLFTELLNETPVTWKGTTRAALVNQSVYPTTESGSLRTWVGVGGSPESVVRTASHGLPMMLAIIGGSPVRFLPYVDLYKRAFAQLEQPEQKVGMHSPGFVAATDQEARNEFFPHYRDMHARIGASRGWPALTRLQFDAEASPEGALYVGSPETVAKKIARNVEALGVSRFDMKYSAGTLSHESMMNNIELYGTKVVPMVRELLAAVPASV
ncbi:MULTISPECIES: LLM class flavin-dependent oxidoreductase [Subtercola]|uniref:LLM class flavin-dependent oxidoreductase n=1 Tax=Subtercola vilae TaxID=2056433 RepID=A0A4V4RED4_9MICO|nr:MULTISPECIES: LLM class flavin-dependent oxidoreductase [Subtercola]MEA9985999.1 LLM class flavin-dependent oxidoreductase [Subtercola sp. RTI3]TIH33324.1 LLM class flavin-dependent oxidoreductase [Subtercola vilae]